MCPYLGGAYPSFMLGSILPPMTAKTPIKAYSSLGVEVSLS